jgi:CNT family concentrative nucleoside transporter
MSDIPGRIVSFLGIFVILGIAYLFSADRKSIRWQTVIAGLLLQIVFAVLVLLTPPGKWLFQTINDLVVALLNFTEKGSSFVFGGLVSDRKTFGFIFAFQVLPTIIFFSSFMGVLYYLGIMQKVVELVAKLIVKVMRTSGAETLCCSANIFLGQTEAPLLIRPYVETTTRSELLAVMAGGFATISGGVMAAYVGMLKDVFPDAAGHLLTASVISAPGALVMAKMLIPEKDTPETLGAVSVDTPKTEANVIDAAAGGASVGLQMALNVGAMLLAFIALIAMLDAILTCFGNMLGAIFHTTITLNLNVVFGTVFSPVAWILGVPWKECPIVGSLMGKMLVINEFVAYSDLSKGLIDGTMPLSPRSVVIAIYAICGFANLTSIAIQIGGIGALAPSRRADLAKLGIYGLLAGTLTCYQTAAIAGCITPAPQLVPKTEKPASITVDAPLRPMVLDYQGFSIPLSFPEDRSTGGKGLKSVQARSDASQSYGVDADSLRLQPVISWPAGNSEPAIPLQQMG